MKVKDVAALRQAVNSSGLSHREIAGACRLKHHSMIGHLTSGRLRTCTPQLADRLERILRASKGSLFAENHAEVMPSASTVQPAAGRVA